MKNIDWDFILWILIAIVAIAISLGITYAIAVSDMPVWLKFWLLK